jgi:HAD superfamily hydrolase (TIGR01509 family)
MPTDPAVIFDAFGTIVQIGAGSHPYRRLLQEGIRQGRRPQPDDAHVLMTRPLNLEGAAEHFGIKISPQGLRALEEDLERELESVKAFPEAILAVRALKRAGIRVGVCSNLAMPYAAAIERLFPSLDAYTYSFSVGALKPEPAIYADACRKLNVEPGQAFMIGDSARCDRDGPMVAGIKGHHLSLDGQGDFTELMSFTEFVLRQRH